jgi:hypothetical protein
MLTYAIALLALAIAPQTPFPNEGENVAPPPSMHNAATGSCMMISPADRALDFEQAFELLRKEKTTGKVFFQLSDGSIISNVIEMTLLPNSTLFLLRFNSQQGIRFQVVKIEEIKTISYSP